MPFNDGWLFKRGPFAANETKTPAFTREGWEEITFPHTWNATDMQLQHNAYYAGEAYYKKSFRADTSWKGKAVFLRFEGAGQVAELFVNGELAGNHRGGYSAFAFDLSAMLEYGAENELLLRVDNASRPDVIPVNHALFGVYGGVYRPAWIVVTEPVHVTVTDYASPGVYIMQDNVSRRRADITVKVKLVNETARNAGVILETLVRDADGKLVARQESPVILAPDGMQESEHRLHLRRPHLWNGRQDP